MAVNNEAVRTHINRALAKHAGESDFLRRLTKAFRLLQAERRVPEASHDDDLAAAEHYMFARQAVASNAVSLSQMLIMVVGYDATRYALERVGLSTRVQVETSSPSSAPASRDSIGWGVAGAMRGETDRETWLPGSTPPPFKPAFMKAGAPRDKVVRR
jgi:hypothetical protein